MYLMGAGSAVAIDSPCRVLGVCLHLGAERLLLCTGGILLGVAVLLLRFSACVEG